MLKKYLNNKGLPREASAKWGFTLLELLVVIGIISILAAIGAASYSTIQKKARDARRKADISSMQNAYEQYYAVCGSEYPYCDGGVCYGLVMSGSNIAIKCASQTTNIVDSTPKDPLNTGLFTYTAPTFASDSYQICALLESDAGNTTMLGSDKYFCLKNQQ